MICDEREQKEGGLGRRHGRSADCKNTLAVILAAN
jgi:hypothetical protein